MNKLEHLIMAAFITGSMGMGGAVLMTVSDNQVKLAENGTEAQGIRKDIQVIRLEMKDFDDRIDNNTSDIRIINHAINLK